MKKILFLFVVMTVLLTGCGADKTVVKQDKLQVAASFYPVAEFVRAVGGDKVAVQTMIGDGIEPHDWEPTAQDLKKLSQAKILFYNGGVEPWATAALEAVKASKVVGAELGAGLYTIGGAKDPHVWLSPKKAVLEVEVVKKALINADQANAAVYEANAKAYQQKLSELDARLQAVAGKAKQKAFVTTHAAFGHLAADYGLEQLPIMGISPDAEPTPADLNNLVKAIGSKKIEYVFFETLVSPRVAQTVAETAKVKTLVLDPIEGLNEQGRAAKDTYLSVMSRNIDNLEKALNGK